MKSMEIQVGKPVTGSNLIGRDHVIREIEQCVGVGRSIALIAPRRYGKTSILLEILRRIRQQSLFSFYLDVFSVPDLHSLAAEITRGVLSNRKLDFTIHQLRHQLAELMQNLQFRQEVEGSEFILRFGQASANAWDLLKSSLHLMESFSRKHQTRTIACFDEFGDIEKLNGDSIVKLFRSELQLQSSTVCLFSGSYESVMSNLFISSSAPFYRFARIIHLGPIDPDEFSRSLTPVFKQQDFEQPDLLAQQITGWTQGHPYYTQMVAQQALFYRNLFRKEDRNIHELIRISLDAEVNYFEKVWDDFAGKHQEKQVVMEIAKGNASLYETLDSRKINISRTVKRLLKAGLLKKEQGGYQLSDPLLHYWIRVKILKLDPFLVEI